MHDVRVWRAIAAVALLGWAGTAVMLWPGSEPVPSEAGPSDGTSSTRSGEMARADLEGADRGERKRRVFRDAPGPAGRGPRRVPPGTERTGAARAGVDGEIPDEVLEVAREQVRNEWRARREAHAEERLDRSLEEIATFVEDHGLDEDTHVALEAAVTDLHGRMQELWAQRGEHGANGGEEDEAAHEARREQFRDSMAKMEREVTALLGEELAESFLESTRGGPPRGPRFR
ncbi:MAG: hypothetical protein R3F61_06550 [Myxococcota bacterium]